MVLEGFHRHGGLDYGLAVAAVAEGRGQAVALALARAGAGTGTLDRLGGHATALHGGSSRRVGVGAVDGKSLAVCSAIPVCVVNVNADEVAVVHALEIALGDGRGEGYEELTAHTTGSGSNIASHTTRLIVPDLSVLVFEYDCHGVQNLLLHCRVVLVPRVGVLHSEDEGMESACISAVWGNRDTYTVTTNRLAADAHKSALVELGVC